MIYLRLRFGANSRCQQFQVITLINLMVLLLAESPTVSLAKPIDNKSVYNKPTSKVWHFGHGHYQGDCFDIYIAAQYTGPNNITSYRLCEYEVKKLRSPACCKQENATFSSLIHATNRKEYFRP